MTLRIVLYRITIAAALVLAASVGGGWKWDKVPF
jgi:hypothetical protein